MVKYNYRLSKQIQSSNDENNTIDVGISINSSHNLSDLILNQIQQLLNNLKIDGYANVEEKAKEEKPKKAPRKK